MFLVLSFIQPDIQKPNCRFFGAVNSLCCSNVYDVHNLIETSFFSQQLKVIFSALPKTRQNLLFSATITDTLEKVKEVASNKVRKLNKNTHCGIPLVLLCR
jgi:hypothetical protein